MQAKQRVVTLLPLSEIWNDTGIVSVERGRLLNKVAIIEILRSSKIRFAVANTGDSLRWVPEDDAHTFWKDEVKLHLANPASERINLEDFPGEYCYLASEWQTTSGTLIILLEKWH